MKLFILKLLSLIVFCLGLISLAYAFGFAPVTDFLAEFPERLVEWKGLLPEQLKILEGVLEVKMLWIIGSVAAIVFGVYGFFPRFSKWRKPKRISYDGPHGPVQIQLDTVEHSLNNVLSRMPEVKKIDVTVEPRDGGRSALIRANAVLQHQPGQNARAIAGLVSDYIAETATKMLGLEELATIELNVLGINVNSRKSSKAIRKESLSHSGNAPVELLEAAPKPLGLSAPGEPLGSGPIEEEMEEEEGGHDSTMEANAVDSKEEESKQAAARSELLEPLSIHQVAEQQEEDAAAPEEPDQADEEVEETPDIEEASVEGSRVNASVVPEPLGDLGEPEESDEDEDGEEEEGGESVSDEELSAEEGDGDLEEDSVSEVDVEESESDGEHIPEAIEEEPEASAENDSDTDTDTEEETKANSPWAPLESEPETDDTDVTTPEADEASTDGGIGFAWEKQSVDGESEVESTEDAPAADGDTDSEDNKFYEGGPTDSIVGDLSDDDGDTTADEETDVVFESESETPEGDEQSEDEKKKGWGWFN